MAIIYETKQDYESHMLHNSQLFLGAGSIGLVVMAAAGFCISALGFDIQRLHAKIPEAALPKHYPKKLFQAAAWGGLLGGGLAMLGAIKAHYTAKTMAEGEKLYQSAGIGEIKMPEEVMASPFWSWSKHDRVTKVEDVEMTPDGKHVVRLMQERQNTGAQQGR